MNDIPKGAPVNPTTLQWIPNSGDYFPAPAVKRKDQYGQYDISTPKHLLDTDDNYLAILTTAENRHPQEDQIVEHYARQRAAKLAGTYDPLEDSPIILRDLLPTVMLVVNKVFNKHEVTIGGEKCVEDYVRAMQKHIDFDLVPVLCGKPIVLPLHPLLPKKHRDKVLNAHMETFYKNHDKGMDEIMERMNKAREESNKRKKEQLEREAREHAEKVAAREKARAEKKAIEAAAAAAVTPAAADASTEPAAATGSAATNSEQ